MPTLTCDASLILDTPCQQCETETEKKAFEVRNWALANGLDVSDPTVISNLMTNSKCIACLSESQLANATVSILRNKFDTVSGVTFAQKRAQVKNLAVMPKSRLNAILVYLQCAYWNSH